MRGSSAINGYELSRTLLSMMGQATQSTSRTMQVRQPQNGPPVSGQSVGPPSSSASCASWQATRCFSAARWATCPQSIAPVSRGTDEGVEDGGSLWLGMEHLLQQLQPLAGDEHLRRVECVELAG